MNSPRALAGMLVGVALLFPSVALAESFSASPTTGVAPVPVSFSYPYASAGAGAGDDSTWMMDIDFGDGSFGKMLPPSVPPCTKNPSGVVDCPSGGQLWKGTHMYTSAGTYTATLTRGGLPRCYICSAPVLGTLMITVTGSQ